MNFYRNYLQKRFCPPDNVLTSSLGFVFQLDCIPFSIIHALRLERKQKLIEFFSSTTIFDKVQRAMTHNTNDWAKMTFPSVTYSNYT